jgi:hypothetical protein
VLIDVSRTVDQNVGESVVQVPEEPQFWSHGTSGQFDAVDELRLEYAQVTVDVGRHRWEMPNSTCAAGLAPAIASDSR